MVPSLCYSKKESMAVCQGNLESPLLEPSLGQGLIIVFIFTIHIYYIIYHHDPDFLLFSVLKC